jgi:alcohol dehydrogenase
MNFATSSCSSAPGARNDVGDRLSGRIQVKIRGAVLEEIGRPRPYASSRPISVSDLELDPPGPTELLIAVEAAGLCHSDLSVVDGIRPRPVPMLLGHEAAGRVVEVGQEVSDIAVGNRVVLTFLPRCGSCAGCRSGRLPCEHGSRSNTQGTLFAGETRLWRNGEPISHHLGVSGFASHTVVDRRSVVRVEDDVPPQVAALLGCAVLTGGGAVLNEAKPAPGDTTVIVGLGGVGMAALLTAVALNAGPVIGVDMNEAKLATARELGATAVMTPPAAVRSGVSAACVIEAAGSARALETALDLTAPGGKTVTVGLPGLDARASISPLDLVAGARSIVGSYLGSALPERDIPLFVDLWREGRLPVERLVSSVVGLDRLNEAMDALAEGRALRQMIIFEDGA